MDEMTTAAKRMSSSFASVGSSQSIFSAQRIGMTTADTSFYSEQNGDEYTKQAVKNSDISSSFPPSSALEEIMRIFHYNANRGSQQLSQLLDDFHL